MKPNMARTVLRFAELITKRETTQTVVNHIPQNTYIDTEIKATVTTPKSEDLAQIEIDTALKYKLFHLVTSVKINDRFIYDDVEYKIISLQDRSFGVASVTNIPINYFSFANTPNGLSFSEAPMFEVGSPINTQAITKKGYFRAIGEEVQK